MELKRIIKEIRGGSSVSEEQKEREEKVQKREMKAKMALEMPDFRLGDGGDTHTHRVSRYVHVYVCISQKLKLQFLSAWNEIFTDTIIVSH